jgi:YesN/AraC family two-component response regulator
MEALARSHIVEEQHGSDGNMCYIPNYFSLAEASLSHIFNSLNEMLLLYRRKHYNRSLIALKLSELFIRLSRENLATELQKSSKRNTKSYVKVQALLEYIHHHYQSKITSGDIESRFECNFDYINRIFNKFTGHPITHYVNLVRINHAQELIEATHLSFGEIAYLVGFHDPYYFSKVFKKYAGLSPIQYYKRNREAE